MESEEFTADAVVVGAAGDGASENRERVRGEGVREGNEGHAYAHGRGGATVQSQH